MATRKTVRKAAPVRRRRRPAAKAAPRRRRPVRGMFGSLGSDVKLLVLAAVGGGAARGIKSIATGGAAPFVDPQYGSLLVGVVAFATAKLAKQPMIAAGMAGQLGSDLYDEFIETSASAPKKVAAMPPARSLMQDAMRISGYNAPIGANLYANDYGAVPSNY